jgi:hypothetical protein
MMFVYLLIGIGCACGGREEEEVLRGTLLWVRLEKEDPGRSHPKVSLIEAQL